LRRAGIRREEQSVLSRKPPHIARPHPCFDAHAPEDRFEREHPVEALEAEDAPAVQRTRSSGEAGAASSRHDWRPAFVTGRDDGGDLTSFAGCDHEVRLAAEAPRLRLAGGGKGGREDTLGP